MAAPGPMGPSEQVPSPTPENLRQRQREQLGARGAPSKGNRIATTVREVQGAPKSAVRLSAAPKTKQQTRRLSPELSRNRLKQDDNYLSSVAHARAKGSSGDSKFSSITPDGGSAGREGRQFTVANVGNNGRIYLRPSVRPANQRLPQPPFVFPITPPSTAGLGKILSAAEEGDSQRDSLLTAARSPPTTPARRVEDDASIPNQPPQSRHSPHRRAHSSSTVDGQHDRVHTSDIGAFKVIIERPGTDRRPKTANEVGDTPVLEVAIPSYRLGTPRFTMRGTPFIRGSSYAGTNDDVRSSVFSQSQQDVPLTNRDTLHPQSILTRRHSHASPQVQYIQVASPSPLDSSSLPSPTIMHPRGPIEPAMYNALTFKPLCDDRSVVRYSSLTGSITAATPPRLVAEITSPSFLDYDLLSDFFLTYRSFLSPSDLLALLVARLQWATGRNDEVGMVVRVRTFVAIRHWILNYFMDDYVVDYDLRKEFCDLINAFVEGLMQRPTGEKNHLKILSELKKCWRRTCALYWDGEEFYVNVGPQVPITPGGIAGSRDPHLTPTFYENPGEPGPSQGDGGLPQEHIPAMSHNYFAEISKLGFIDPILTQRELPAQYESKGIGQSRPGSPTSPLSIISVEALSCSFPALTRAPQLEAKTLAAHPVPVSTVNELQSPIARTPKALTGKRIRPTQTHRRSGSFSDSLRDDRAPKPVLKIVKGGAELVMALPYAGSLVRGNLFPPGQAFVEMIAPSTPAEINRATSYFNNVDVHTKGPSGMSGPAMKKLLGSVRRALSTKTSGSGSGSPTATSFPHVPPIGARGATVNRLPGTAVVPQARARNTGARAPMRLDILGAGIAEDFKRAIREEAELDTETVKDEPIGGLIMETVPAEFDQYPPVPADPETDPGTSFFSREATKSGITNGSKSIVIVDDTLALNLPVMSGAIAANRSMETFTEGFLHPSDGLTPPTTPPDQHAGSPRRSSHLLGLNPYHHNRSLSLERTPSLVQDFRSPSETELSPNYPPLNRPSLHSYQRSNRSNRSHSLRRYASFHSGLARRMTERSFDATTFSGSGEPEPNSPTAAAPPRILRRRPGGDLRAVANVGDLAAPQLRRTHSTGSMTTYSDSVRSSYPMGRESSGYVNVVSSDDFSNDNMAATFSLGALAEAAPKKQISLFSTHSSKPIMRPSFEAEAAKLAQIPDDDDDDGGPESALLKLEGKFEQRRSDASIGSSNVGGPSHEAAEDEEKRRHRHKHVLENDLSQTPPLLNNYPDIQVLEGEELKPAVYQPGRPSVPEEFVRSVTSEDSYSSIPILQRDVSHFGPSRSGSKQWKQPSPVMAYDEPEKQERVSEVSHPSIEVIEETESMKRIPIGDTAPRHVDSVGHSFLADDSDADSDLSSEMSLEVISRKEYTEKDSISTFPPLGPGTTITDIALPTHPLRHPSSPIITMNQALSLAPETATKPVVQTAQSQPYGAMPPTPENTPTMTATHEGFAKQSSETGNTVRHIQDSDKQPRASGTASVHLPFILAFDSKVLAEQFTLIEKDALNEIDWKELIDMRWRNASANPRSWVDFLRTQEARGVEVVIARFNIMVKWAVSECVLTQNLEERVQCLVKFIHIAAQCRRYRNFATMYQLTVALTSNDITRLTKTWAKVPPAELVTLRELEELVQPTRNFHNLRAEMEGSGADKACIPFVGLYTHDLLFNSQRPSQIASTPTTEPLVNFERCRMTAAIVKNLLRLLEASTLYQFQPIEGITERCLWMAALSDEDIRKYGQTIE